MELVFEYLNQVCIKVAISTLKAIGKKDSVIFANRRFLLPNITYNLSFLFLKIQCASATYLSLKRFVPALHDAIQSANADPTNWKAYWRQVVAY